MANEKRPVADLFAELLKIADEPLESNSVIGLQQTIKTNPFYKAIQSNLLDEKSKIALKPSNKDNVADENLFRLDSMLRSEGLMPRESYKVIPNPIINENNEFMKRFRKVKEEFVLDRALCEKNRKEMCDNVNKLMKLQGEFRPISEVEIEKMTNHISKKFDAVSTALKQNICDELVQLRRKIHDGGRKRRHFPEHAIPILNNYFFSNLNHPYPSEEMKHALAAQCGITATQVSNWFSNKRIRYKKNLKNGEISEEQKKLALPAALRTNNMMNQTVVPGPHFAVPLFQIPVYNTEMMAQWQKAQQNQNSSK